MSQEPGFWDGLTELFSYGIHSRLFTLLVLLYFLCFLDVFTTVFILRIGGYELNTFMIGFAASPVMHLLLKWLIVFVIYVLAAGAEQKIKNSGGAILGVACLWYLIVVFHNLSVIVIRFFSVTG
jgi:hypothetical protein